MAACVVSCNLLFISMTSINKLNEITYKLSDEIIDSTDRSVRNDVYKLHDETAEIAWSYCRNNIADKINEYEY